MQKAHQKIIILNLKKEKKNKTKKKVFFLGGGEGIMGSWKQASNHTIIRIKDWSSSVEIPTPLKIPLSNFLQIVHKAKKSHIPYQTVTMLSKQSFWTKLQFTGKKKKKNERLQFTTDEQSNRWSIKWQLNILVPQPESYQKQLSKKKKKRSGLPELCYTVHSSNKITRN